MEAPTESRGVSKQKWLDDRKRKIGKLLDANGLDMTKAYMLDTQEAAEEKYKKWEKDPAPFGWDGMFFYTCSRYVRAQSISILSSCHDYLCDRTGPKQRKFGQFYGNSIIYNTTLKIILNRVQTNYNR